MTMKGSLKGLVCALTVALLATGCATQRRWGMCAVGGGLLGATAGGVGAGVIRYNSGSNGVASDRTTARPSATKSYGGIIGAVLGHYICDPIDDAAAQAP
jgi:hypothetical protein